ncbi:13341_t:CDS:2 [Ambispora leptoticha]|uniref:13341_t:CDS:1 n=1 Tax=Ambispora leptoticha TaxID=144679 RepID=A0A9N9GL34_9GLOM|nr:13341_t:CDS:2 [Ambispora leptoticha]
MFFMFRTSRDVYKEPKTFRNIRVITATIVVLTYLAYILFLLFQVWSDKPVIQIANEELSFIEMPNIEICGYGSDIEITRCDFTKKDWSDIVHPKCAKDNGGSYLLTKPVVNLSYCYVFMGNGSLFFSKDNNDNDNILQQIIVYFKILNLTGAESASLSVPTVAVQLLDPSFDPLTGKVRDSDMGKDVEDNLRLQLNNFAGIQNFSTSVKMTKSVYREIPPRDVNSLFGLNPKYINITTITAYAQYYPLHSNPNFTADTDTGFFQISAGSFLQQVQTEKRVRNLFSALGVAGGGFSAICVIYIVLFGDRKTRPWGLMHYIVRSEVEQFGHMDNIPLLPQEDGKTTLTSEERLARMEDRFKVLEEILGDYFFDIAPLKSFKQRHSK